jgi:hypothetical protein
VRKNIGGHITLEVAGYAVEKLNVGLSKIEFMTSAKGPPTDARLPFAGDIAAAAIFRGLPDQKNPNAAIQVFIRDVVVEGYRHAARIVQVLIATHLAQSFGRS